MKNLANMAIVAIAALTFEACSSTRSTTGRTDTSSVSGSVSPATGDASGISSGNTTGSGTGTTGSGMTGSGTSGNTTTGSGSGTTGSGTSGSATTSGSGIGTSDTNTGGGSTGNAGAGGATSDEASQFIHQAAISGMSEIQLSQLALKNAQSSAVKKFAAMMVKDHGGANAELKALAATKDVTLPDSSDIGDATSDINTAGSTGTMGSATTGTSAGTTGSGTTGSGAGGTDNTSGGSNMSPAEKMERLRTSSNKEFDQNYVQLMIRDHVKAISLFESGSRSADPQVKAYASKHLPTLRKHLQQVTDLGKTTITQSKAQ